MSDIREIVDTYVKRVRELIDHVKGNEQATKQSLIGPFLTMLGYDLTDPRECIPEFKVDFGKDRSTKPIDWAFMHTPARTRSSLRRRKSVASLRDSTSSWRTISQRTRT